MIRACNFLRILKHLGPAALALAAALLPALAIAQDAPAPAGDDVVGTLLTVWMYIGTAVIGGLGLLGAWLSPKFVAWVKAKTDSAILQGLAVRAVRLRELVHNAVASVNQTLKAEIAKAKDPSSDGGERITDAEKQRLFDAAWEAVKAQAGGWQGLLKSFLSLAGGSEDALKAQVTHLIETEVGAQKLAAKAAAPGPQ